MRNLQLSTLDRQMTTVSDLNKHDRSSASGVLISRHSSNETFQCLAKKYDEFFYKNLFFGQFLGDKGIFIMWHSQLHFS